MDYDMMQQYALARQLMQQGLTPQNPGMSGNMVAQGSAVSPLANALQAYMGGSMLQNFKLDQAIDSLKI